MTFSDSSGRSREWAWAVLITIGAFLGRVAFLASSPDRQWPHSVYYEGDAPLWADYAASLARGQPLEFNLPIHPPGMAWFLRALGVGAAGGLYSSQKLVFAGLGSAAAGLAVLVAAPIFGPAVAVAAGLMAATSFGLHVQSTSLNGETPYTLLLMSILLSTAAVGRRPSAVRLLLTGFLNGLAVLFRPEHTAFFLLSLAGIVARPGGRSCSAFARQLLLLMVGFLALPLPWSIRSHRAIQRFNTIANTPAPDFASTRPPWSPAAAQRILDLPAFARDGNFGYITHLAARAGLSQVDTPFVDAFFAEMGYTPRPLSPYCFISLQGALCFALANNAHADGGFSTRLLDVVLGAPAPEGHVSVNDFAFGNPRHLRLVQHGWSIGLDYLLHHPLDALGLAGRKLAIFASGLGGGFSPANLPLGLSGQRRPVDQFAVPAGLSDARSMIALAFTLCLLALALLGAGACLRRRTGGMLLLVIAVKLVVALAFFGYARQAVSILPVFYILVALGAERLFAAIRTGHRAPPALPRSAGDDTFSGGEEVCAGGTSPRAAHEEAAAPARRPRFGVAGVILVLSGLAGLGLRPPLVDGRITPAPRWGEGAFESNQLLTLRQP
jgi:hypothetical protein